MGVIQGRVEQAVDLHRDRCQRGLGGIRRLALGRAQRQADAGRHRRYGIVDAAQDEVAGGQRLGVVEEDDLRPPGGLHVPFQIARDHQQPVDGAGQDQPAPFGKIGDAPRHRDIGRGVDGADDGARQVGPVEVEHGDRQAGGEAGAENRRQQPHQAKRQKGHQHQQTGTAPAQPDQFTLEDQEEAGTQPGAGPHLNAPAGPRWRSFPAAVLPPARPGRPGPRRSADRNRRWRGSPAMSRIVPGR